MFATEITLFKTVNIFVIMIVKVVFQLKKYDLFVFSINEQKKFLSLLHVSCLAVPL